MIKFLFLDYREIETARGFTRELERPRKHPRNPLLRPDQPWENGSFTLYGSVVKADGMPFQMWYTVVHRPWRMYLAYAESDDGLVWRKPLCEVFRYRGRKTNIVLDADPHGTAVIHDPAEPDPRRRYKLMAGAAPSGCITPYASPDGIHWRRLRRHAAIGTNPDSPMALYRARDGRYVAHHRVAGLGRRICRSESWDFVNWSGEPQMVMEPDAGDPPQTQFYGMGATPYGTYLIGTLWMFRTEAKDRSPGKMRGYQEAELTYARSGTAWHRAAQGRPFIPHGGKGKWDSGNLQCASAPVFLDDEIRYYYAGTDMRHKTHWELDPQRAGLGVATLKPDRFVALRAGDGPAEFVTICRRLPSTDFRINARTGRDGWVRVALLGKDYKPLKGFGLRDCVPVAGNGLAHHVCWRGSTKATITPETYLRLRVRAKEARVYSISVLAPGERPVYHRFQAAWA